jgi:hypothetical protein
LILVARFRRSSTFRRGHLLRSDNPRVVSFGAFLRGSVAATEMLLCWAAQPAGALLAFTFGYLMTGHSNGIHPGSGVKVLQAVGVEIFFTAAPLMVMHGLPEVAADHIAE